MKYFDVDDEEVHIEPLYEGRKLIFQGPRQAQAQWVKSLFPAHATFVNLQAKGALEILLKKEVPKEVMHCEDVGLASFLRQLQEDPMEFMGAINDIGDMDKIPMFQGTTKLLERALAFMGHDKLAHSSMMGDQDCEGVLRTVEALAYRVRNVQMQQTLSTEALNGPDTLWFYETDTPYQPEALRDVQGTICCLLTECTASRDIRYKGWKREFPPFLYGSVPTYQAFLKVKTPSDA